MRKLTTLLLTLALGLLPALPARAESSPRAVTTGTFSFVHITDPHVGTWQGNTNFAKVIDDILRLPEQPAFGLMGGDHVETGAPAEYNRFDQEARRLPFPLHYTLGNHEARWLDPAKQQFQQRYGSPYSSFTYEGVHFVLLDTSIHAETHGRLETPMLEWLKNDLSKVGPITPVVIVTHHPIAYDPGRFLDNDEDFFDAVEGYNVKAVLTGHGHLNLYWDRNNIHFFMTEAALDGGYKYITVADGVMTVYNHSISGAPWRHLTIDLSPTPNPGKVTVKTVGNTVIATHNELPHPVDKAEYRINMGSWQALQPSGENRYEATVDTSKLLPGFHEIQVRLTVGQRTYTDRTQLSLPGSPALVWQFRAGGAIQGAPVVSGNRLIVASLDGKVYALNQSGKQLWQYYAGGPIISSPEVVNNRVYVATTKGKVIALDATSGQRLWERSFQDGFVGSPRYAEGALYVGSTSGKLYSFAAADGKLNWTYQAGGALRSKPAFGGGKVFIAGWNQAVQAIDAASGQLVWQQPIGRNIYYSPANADPLYHEGRLFVTSPDNTLHAFAALDGKKLWAADVQAGYSTPLIHGQDVVVGTLTGHVHGFDPVTGQQRWVASAGASTYDSSPRSHGGDLVIGGLWGRVSGVRPGGDYLWKVQLGQGLIYADPVPFGDLVIQVGMDGGVYALAAKPTGPVPSPWSTFTDLAGHWAAGPITELAARGLVGGYEDGRYDPEGNMTRGQYAALLSRFLGVQAPSPGYQTKLVDVDGFWGEAAILALEELGLINGIPEDGELYYRPDSPLTRAEAAALLARALGLGETAPNEATPFADLGGHWAEAQVTVLAERGLINGIKTGSGVIYDPQAPFNRAQAAALIGRALLWHE